MEQKLYSDPPEILEITVNKGIAKSNAPIWKQLILSTLAGVFIAFAAASSNMAAYGFFLKPETYGLGKFVAGLVFPVGLMFVVMAGAELFTGNNLIIVSVLEKKVSVGAMLKNWALVYIGNFLGSVLIAGFIIITKQLNSGAGLLGAVTIKIAYGKVSLDFIQALVLGIMCNWVVCLAVWLCFGAKSTIGRIFSAFFPILLFVSAGFEHSVANMYYVPAGIFAKSFPKLVEASHISPELLTNLNWTNFIVKNLIPVTIGNIIGGAFFVGFVYWICYRKKNN